MTSDLIEDVAREIHPAAFGSASDHWPEDYTILRREAARQQAHAVIPVVLEYAAKLADAEAALMAEHKVNAGSALSAATFAMGQSAAREIAAAIRGEAG